MPRPPITDAVEVRIAGVYHVFAWTINHNLVHFPTDAYPTIGEIERWAHHFEIVDHLASITTHTFCRGCDRLLDRDHENPPYDSNFFDVRQYCSECVATCYFCPQRVAILQGNEDNVACPSCTILHRCPNCSIYTAWDNTLCGQCEDSGIGECDSCSHFTSYLDDDCLCPSCASSNRLQETTFNENKFTRTVGIELEFYSPNEPRLSHLGTLKGDGSLSDRCPEGHDAHEFASRPANGDTLLNMIDAATAQIHNRDGVVNQACGFHAHIYVGDLNSLQRDNIYQAWWSLEKIIYCTQAVTRRSNYYCAKLPSYDPGEVYERYHGLNRLAYSKYKTFEIRLHAGTLDAHKIKSWCMFLLHFFETFKDISFPRSTVREMTYRQQAIFLFQQCKLPYSLKKYFIKRLRRCNRNYIVTMLAKENTSV